LCSFSLHWAFFGVWIDQENCPKIWALTMPKVKVEGDFFGVAGFSSDRNSKSEKWQDLRIGSSTDSSVPIVLLLLVLRGSS
jgi:hypothetical protein